MHDGKQTHMIEVGVFETIAVVRNAALDHRPPDSRAATVLLTERVASKRISDTGSFDDNSIFETPTMATMAELPTLTDIFIYDLCQGGKLRGETTRHRRLCHPRSDYCEAHRKQAEREPKLKRLNPAPRDTAATSLRQVVADDAKRRKLECSLSFEVLVHDVCRLGTELLGLLTTYAPLRTQIRQAFTDGRPAFISLRWPTMWASEEALGFDPTAVVIESAKSATLASRQVAVRSSRSAPIPGSTASLRLDCRWDFAGQLSLALLTLEFPAVVRVQFHGIVGGEIRLLTEFVQQTFPAPVLFASALHNQPISFDAILVQVQCAVTGELVHQQVVKLTNPANWSDESSRYWVQLVACKTYVSNPSSSVALGLHSLAAASSPLQTRDIFPELVS